MATPVAAIRSRVSRVFIKVPSEKTLLQICVAVAACVPVSAGAAGLLLGAAMIPHTQHLPSLDSHYRYLSGLLLAIGLGFWSAVPHIERRTERVRLLAAVVVVGGLARLLGMLHETPGVAMRLALVMELVVTPLICLWQGRVARLAGTPARRFRLPVVAGRADALRPDPGPGR